MCFSRFYSELIPIVVIELERKISCYSICIVKFNNDESKSISVCKYHDLKLYKKHADKSVVLCRPQDWVEVGSQPNGGQGPIHFISFHSKGCWMDLICDLDFKVKGKVPVYEVS
jgi:hypothetical protein